MTHRAIGIGGGPMLVPSAAIGRPAQAASPFPAHLSREVLRLGIALRREALAKLEAEMVEACETAAGSGDPRTCAPDDRALWDRGAWRRYLDAAARLEGCYGPRMRRLRDDIARLERLLDLPVAA